MEYGNANVPNRYTTQEGLKLGEWVHRQRYLKSKNLLSSAFTELLEKLPEWSWSEQQKSWFEVFEQLQAYVNQNGDARVPAKYICKDDFKLGTWVMHNRQNKAKGRLNSEQIEMLESLPGWSWDVLTGQWSENFERLQAYITEFGNARVPGNYLTEDGFKLGAWIANRRTAKSKNKLSSAQIDILESLPGWSWDVLTDQWDENFEQLQIYFQHHGHVKVPANLITKDGVKLGKWVSRQRQFKMENLLSQERIQRLDAMPGWFWSEPQKSWFEMFELLQIYVNEHGNAKVPANYKTQDDIKLGSWINRQRTVYRYDQKYKDILTPDQIKLLEALPGWAWNPYEDRWEEMFVELQAYVKDFGNSSVSQKYVTEKGIKLGTWVNSQRRFKHRLTPDRISRLEALPGWSWNAREKNGKVT